VVCVGKNYAEHVREMATGDAPEQPLLFLKPSTTVIGPGDAIRIPPGSTNVHHEVSSAVGHRRRGRATVTRSRRWAACFGYTDRQRRHRADMQKGRRASDPRQGLRLLLPAGPWIETDLAAGQGPADLEVTCTVTASCGSRAHQPAC
jgi:2-keto-4-pentenoate hydratase/2-oxohepta-3-ene-1,7-dioic acid hydratase in catechol pathway